MSACIAIGSILFVGAIWYVDFLNYHLNIAVWVGLIALAGVAAETGVIMVMFLDEACVRRQRENRLHSLADLRDAIIEGAVLRVRPKIMTASAIILGLLPIMWSQGTGADVMKRIAAPMIGGMVTATALTLLVIPVIYFIWRSRISRVVFREHGRSIPQAHFSAIRLIESVECLDLRG